MKNSFCILSLILILIKVSVVFTAETHVKFDFNYKKCETNDDCLSYHYCIEGYCVHKGLNPVYPLEIFVLLFFAAFSMIATSAGIGGGAIYSALLMFVENFSANQAFPVSNFVILLCAITTFYIGVKDKIENPTNKFIDYDLVTIFGPTLLLGTKIGVICNRVFPSLFLNVMLILVLAYSSYKSYKK